MAAHPVPPPFPPLSITPTPNPFSLLSNSPPPPPEHPRSSSDPAPPPCPNPASTSDPPPPPCPAVDPTLAPLSSSSPPLYNPRSVPDLVQSKASSSSLPPPPPPPTLPHRPPTSLHSDRLPHHQRPNPVNEPKGINPPPQQLSYAQAAKSSRGPSFVRAHANEVESFAKIPRTGVNIICGSKEGVPSFSFVSADLARVEGLYSNALVMKFHGGRPSLESSHKEILSWGIEHPFSIGPLTSRAFLLRFQNNTDLLKVLTRPSSMLITFPYKVFRWHNLCHLKEDSCLAPVWISLPRLPLQCFIPEFLEAVGNKIGRFLCFDKATTTLARPSAARICVELDLRKPPPQFIWVGLFEGFKQQIVYDRMPKFCNGCHVIGHTSGECSKRVSVPFTTTVEEPDTITLGRTQAVRQNDSAATSSNHQAKSSRGDIRSDYGPSRASKSAPDVSKAPDDNHTPTRSAAAPSPIGSEVPPPPPSLSSMPLTPLAVGTSFPVAEQPTTMHKNQKSSRHLKGKQKHKSVTFEMPHIPHQSNLIANKDFWDAVNRQVAIIDQARLKTSSLPSSAAPSVSPHPSTEDPAPSNNMESSPTAHSSDESSGSSIAADSPPASPQSAMQDAQNPGPNFEVNTYESEGDERPIEPFPIQGHNTDILLHQNPQSSKRNKRHPDQPLKVQLRVRKDPNPASLCQ